MVTEFYIRRKISSITYRHKNESERKHKCIYPDSPSPQKNPRCFREIMPFSLQLMSQSLIKEAPIFAFLGY